jgi:predicted nucleic acid-binding protein
LIRLANASDLQHELAVGALVTLHRDGEVLHITAQNLVEFRSVATRAASANGLGLSSDVSEARARDFEQAFPHLPETPEIFLAWRGVVTTLGVVSKQVHDARLVAVCHVHRVTHLLTFNVADVARYALSGPGLVVVHPSKV